MGSSAGQRVNISTRSVPSFLVLAGDFRQIAQGTIFYQTRLCISFIKPFEPCLWNKVRPLGVLLMETIVMEQDDLHLPPSYDHVSLARFFFFFTADDWRRVPRRSNSPWTWGGRSLSTLSQSSGCREFLPLSFVPGCHLCGSCSHQCMQLQLDQCVLVFLPQSLGKDYKKD